MRGATWKITCLSPKWIYFGIVYNKFSKFHGARTWKHTSLTETSTQNIRESIMGARAATEFARVSLYCRNHDSRAIASDFCGIQTHEGELHSARALMIDFISSTMFVSCDNFIKRSRNHPKIDGNHGQRPEITAECGRYNSQPRSIAWLLMPWLLMSSGHQQPRYWQCRINRSLSFTRKDFNHLLYLGVEQL